jgi:metal-responsive CopG/Arc/MetJ family transcriptional regulator
MLPSYPYAKPFSATMPPDLFDRMESARSRLKIKRSAIVQSALEVYLDALDRAEKMIDENEEALAA